MDANNITILLTAIGGPTTIVALYKWAKAQGRAEAVQEQSAATIMAKDKEIAELNAENTRLWDLLTKPGGK